MEKAKPTRWYYSQRMIEYAKEEKEFAVFESDLGKSTYALEFGKHYPDRYFNLGIAEMATLSAAAGMASTGRNVVATGYGVFLTMRALEVIRSFICYGNFNVKFLSSHGGLTPAIDGATHQSTEDIAFMNTLPNMKILSPCDPVSAAAAFDLSMATPGPVFTRLMRAEFFSLYNKDEKFVIGGSKVLREGSDVTIVAHGDTVFEALEASEELAKQGIKAEVIDMYSIKPFDAETLYKSIKKTGALIVVEDHQKRNGLGYELGIFSLKNCPVAFDILGLDDTFGESGDYYQLIDKFGFSAKHIVARAVEMVKSK